MNASDDRLPGGAGAADTRRRTRRAALVAVALVAAGAGALISTRRLRQADADPAADHFWARSLSDPEGAAVALSTWRGKPLLVNFWATWCPPCLEEMPLLSAFHVENKASGMQVLGLAIDKPELVKRFLAARPVSFPVLMAGVEGVELARELGNAAGGLPFSVLFDRQGRIAQRKLGQLRAADLKAWRAAVANG